MSDVAVVAVGGNALTRADQEGTPEQIEDNAAQMAEGIANLCDAGWRVVVVHGNGPQVGNLSIQQEGGADLVPPQPLHALNAMSQGQLGSVLVRAIDSIRGADTAVALISHMTVDSKDPAFETPTKPIGPFFTKAQAFTLAEERGWNMQEDAGRGYRRVVASPRPLEMLESSSIETLLTAGKVVLAAGGGGIAVSREDGGRYRGVDAVIDKDSAAVRLARSVKAAVMILVTGVDAVSIDFGTPQARVIHELPLALAEKYLAEGQFPAGSMGPKVRAGIDFVRDGGEAAVITSAEHMLQALDPAGKVGTRILPETAMSIA
ncbi:carbamate kinase [Streptosporangium sp. NBC_01755]|uniref:carbamate kinase n=1 Tax=unclassified Streptosporangium TaxID=2632669 RepID=UPI002DDB7D1A|nr:MULTISPECIES: carbamate kinase [unclassified Streptosporangium]WSA26442.1 carbamate kinase [Streptosporangium sp. NBC_01810]WSD02128.1 carbamate kinase [Streptosporangium sp. NBC_01755]